MSRERFITSTELSTEEKELNWNLRPKALGEYIGQEKVVRKLSIAMESARRRCDTIEHILFSGPPGLGKTTLAHIIAYEMKTKIITTSGPALERSGDLMGILTNLEESSILFIDEIHRLPVAVEEFLYSAMEDFRVDFIVDKGIFAKSIKVPLKKFTLLGATTRSGLLSAPLRDRFGIFYHLDFYEAEDLEKIIRRSAQILSCQLDDQAAGEIARRSRGTPRIANRLLKRVRDYALVKEKAIIDQPIVQQALEIEGIDELGFDELDRKFLKTIIEVYNGGPVGIEAISATINEETRTLEDTVEPYLLKLGFVIRTKQGRKVTPLAYDHFKLEKLL